MTLSEYTILENRYRIEGMLAEGGMGAVYEAFDMKLQMPIALKENYLQTAEGITQFEQEALILARLHHPNLPRVIDHFIFKDRQYLVMDFVEGKDLWELFQEQKKPLEEEHAVDYMIQVCDAVSYLHQQKPPIIHRDIKPQNIKVTPEGRAVLVDFGIAKVAEMDSRTRTGAQAITPGFSPPEQYSKMGTTPVSDIYSLGATLYAVLTGQYPPDSISVMAGGAKFEPTNVINEKVSERVSRAIAHAMQVQQENRPQSVATWKHELEAILAGTNDGETVALDLSGQTQSQPPSSAPPPTEQAGKSSPPWLWIGLAVIAVVVAIGAIAFMAGRGGSAGGETVDTEAILLALAATATEQAKAGVTEPDVDLEATLVALAATATEQAKTGAVQPPTEAPTDTPTPEPTATPIPPTETPTPEPTATPIPPTDTSTSTPTPTSVPTKSAPSPTPTVPPAVRPIAFVSDRDGNDEIYVMNIDGSEQTNLTNNPTDHEEAPAWSPDGQRLAFTSNNVTEGRVIANLTLNLINADGSEVTSLTTQSGAPAWSPDGTSLAINSAGDYVSIINVDSGQGSRLTQGNGFNPAWSPDGQRIVFDDLVDLFMVNSDGSGLIPLTSSPADENHPVWSPDDQRLAFISNGEGNNEIYVMNPDGSSALRLTFDPAEDIDPAWSPDGTQITFASNRDGNWEIYVMNVDGSEQTNLTKHPANDRQPAWSP